MNLVKVIVVKEAYAKGKLQLTGNWSRLRAQLGDIAQNDAKAEVKVASATQIGCLGTLLVVLGIFTSTLGVGILLLIIGIPITVYGFVRANAASKYDLENWRYQLLRRFQKRTCKKWK